MMAALPVSVEVGTIRPENCCAGTVVRIAVPNSAASCVRVKADISSPMPVVAVT
jgi:hypothetical protein